jgi:hypothetical protein
MKKALFLLSVVLPLMLNTSAIAQQPPTATDDAHTTDEDITLNIAGPGVLTNDTDADSDPLTAILRSGPSLLDLTPEKYDICISIVVVNGVDTGKILQHLISIRNIHFKDA